MLVNILLNLDEFFIFILRMKVINNMRRKVKKFGYCESFDVCILLMFVNV